MSVPSYNALLDLTKDPGLAMELRKVLTGEIDPLSYPEIEKETRTWYHAPNIGSPYVKLMACNHLMGLYGVEWAENKTHPEKSFYYVNTGDTYAETICHRPSKSIFISSWGDIVEKWRE